ncbi:MAG: hypothetical protein D6681_11825 [Calditrichaeota bacterium]|nr:MAG: hypothetical protein D6681_11825 [Calditrichota bacterium]
MERKDWLERAAEHIFHDRSPDVGARLCLENMRYGLAKIHFVQQRLGLTANATFIASPDVTVTINSYRWNSGFGYGGKLSWGDGDQELIFLDTKPNCCGMFVGGLDTLPPKEKLVYRAATMKRERCEIDGIRIKWNLEKGNHFVDVFEVKPLADNLHLPPYAFIAHTSGSELKKESHLGPGLYIDSSAALRDRAEVIQTPFGPVHILTGAAAREYYEFYRVAEAFATKRRAKAAELLFEQFTTIANANHQGLLNANEIALGVNTWQVGAMDVLQPLALRPDLPAYLFRGLPNFTPGVIRSLDWEARARRLGVYHRLENANFMPHGAGYNFPGWKEVIGNYEVAGRRFFELKSTRGEGTEIVGDLRNVPYEYRGEEIFARTVELGLGMPVAELIPIYVLKI